MAETSDYDPGDWRGHDFKAAYKAYDANAGRAYDDAVAKGVTANDLVPDRISTDSESPVVISLDGTGSMGEWPKIIFSKLPYLDIEGKEYMGDTMAISFSVFDDAHNGATTKALQVKPFVKGLELESTLKTMFLPGVGGGTMQESSELGMLYYARNCDMPKATKPLFVVITDEKCYEDVPEAMAKQWCKVDLADTGEKRLTAHKIIRELQRKFAVYAVIKPYENSNTSSSNRAIFNQWVGLLDEEHVIELPEAERVVDVIFGIMAKETGRVAYFEDELKDRQLKDAGGATKVKVVLGALKTIHKSVKALPGPSDPKKGASVTVRGSGAATKRSISLLDD